MPMLDIFNSDAFSVTSLTDAINKLKFVPGYLGSRGLFAESGVVTTSIAIEQKNNVLVLVPPTPRGGPGVTLDKGKRSLLSINVPHFEINDAVYAEEVQNIRPFGQESGEESVMNLLGQRMQIDGQSQEATIEYSRIGAVKCIVTYADGSTLNLFNVFGVAQPAEIAFDLSNAAPVPGVLRKLCQQTIRQIAVALDGTPFTGVEALCGDQFFDNLIAHPEVRASYLNWNAAQELRQSYVSGGDTYGSFPWGGILWTNYRGQVGTQPFIDPTKANIFPTGVPGLFRTYFSPADYMDTVNTLGQPRYVRQYPMQNQKGVHLDVQTNNLNICTRPTALFQGRMGA
ncbi:major capsid protein [Bradyrhizobium barranii subsp. barranii]|uniref:Major capsid protein n=2 Tax=Bradyrhizobium barranii subsp. barranii TaxID=2823807 RepID=A0A9X9YHA2_9BRAD|nr:major capsid protein [Bradyrhizobium barranii]UGX90307.1 major capsid protein [Bradyrhizobium barranii subsp. barranii]